MPGQSTYPGHEAEEQIAMNAQKTAVVVDSGCDVSPEFREKYDIRLLPFKVRYPEKEYLDAVDIDPMMVYRRFPSEIPTTSTPSPGDVVDLMKGLKEEGFENVFVFCISDKLSGTYNTVRMVKESYDLGMNIRPVDTLNISVACGLVAIWAADSLAQGKSFEEVDKGLDDVIRRSTVMFYMDTLDYLKHGGRIGHVEYMAAQLLHIRPIIACGADGSYLTVAKLRGGRQARKRLMEEVKKYAAGRKCWFIVAEGDGHQAAMEAMDMLKKEYPGSTVLYDIQIAASLAVNTGSGLLGIGILPLD